MRTVYMNGNYGYPNISLTFRINDGQAALDVVAI